MDDRLKKRVENRRGGRGIMREIIRCRGYAEDTL
jgi:hypothetical protein